ncbi:MAG: RagB/SusD family nutrient uptake outer membrane protein [Dysgonamonadaceae bacterium]|nr:RagB/SusD family nutrient uptake outer membrane protein [Dysgonamonadaceae bacterium]
MKTKSILTYFSSLLLASLLSCSDMLEEKVFTFVSGEDLIANKNYKELVTGAYNSLSYPWQWGNYHMIVNFDCDYQTGPTWAFGSTGAGNFYEDGSNTNFYYYYYITIRRASYHYYLVSQMDIPEKEKSNAMGELAFLKAWSYFNLVQFYGEIPLYITSISEGAPLNLPRSPIKDVYEHIIECLTFAEEAMYSTKDAEYTKGHPSKGAAKALLAKVYCTIGSASMSQGNKITVSGGPAIRTGDNGEDVRIPFPAKISLSKDQVAGYEGFNSSEYYQLALNKAKELIDMNEYQLYDSQEELWSPSSKNGKEFIFSLQTVPQNDDLGNYFATDYCGYYKENGELTSGYYILRDHWLQMFDETDERITWGVMHRIPFATNSSTGDLRWCYYPARDSVKVRLGIDGYQTTDELRYDAHLYGSKLLKFRQVTGPVDGTRSDFNFPYIRYAEVLLLYAEADNEVNGGPSARAISEVEKLNRRNKSRLASAIGTATPWTQESFRSYILEERAKEFGQEGIRRFDLLRWGIYLQTMNAIGRTDENGVIKEREQRHLLLPLPANEVNTNQYIDTNNPGW